MASDTGISVWLYPDDIERLIEALDFLVEQDEGNISPAEGAHIFGLTTRLQSYQRSARVDR